MHFQEGIKHYGESVNSQADYSIHWFPLGKEYIIIKNKIKIKKELKNNDQRWRMTCKEDWGQAARKVGEAEWKTREESFSERRGRGPCCGEGYGIK